MQARRSFDGSRLLESLSGIAAWAVCLSRAIAFSDGRPALSSSRFSERYSLAPPPPRHSAPWGSSCPAPARRTRAHSGAEARPSRAAPRRRRIAQVAQVFSFARLARLPGVARGVRERCGRRAWKPGESGDSGAPHRRDTKSGKKMASNAPAEPTAEAVNAAGANCYQRITAERALRGSPTYAAS